MFLFQEIPSVQVDFCFAAELFLLVFFFQCWLISPAPKVASKEVNSKINLRKHYLQYCDFIIDELSMKEARKVLIKFKELEMISLDTPLAGKGITKEFLISLIKNKAIQSKEAVAATLQEVFSKS